MAGFNSDEYTWKDIQVVAGGRFISGARSIKWKTERTTTPIFASGSKAHTIKKGNKYRTGSLSVLQSEIEAMIVEAQVQFGPNADLTDLVFNVTVAFVPEVTAPIKTHQVVQVNITEFEMGMTQNDPVMEIELPFIALDINYNI